MIYRLALSILVFTSLSSAAIAQTTPPATPQGLGGPVVPGVCLLSREMVLADSKIGQAASARLNQLANEAQAEVDAERAPIDTDLAALRAQAVSLTAEALQTQEQALSARLQPIQAKADLRSREIEATRAKAVAQIASEAQPLIAQTYTANACGLLVDRNMVLGGNTANDLTPAVLRALDAKISTITFNRETLPAQ